MRFSTKFISSSAVLLAASMVKETTADSAVYAAKGGPYTFQITAGFDGVTRDVLAVEGEADCKVAAEQLNKATPLSAPNLVKCGMSFAGTTLPLPKTCSRTLMGCFAPRPPPPLSNLLQGFGATHQ